MALYEYVCASCGTRTEKRMPMSDVLQFVPCPGCGSQAQKAFGRFALVGVAQPGVEDGPAPWDDGGEGDGGHSHEWGGGSHGHSHGHSHGPGGHSHSHSWDDIDLD
jgi:putative FmdB family regulatory protein